MEILNPPKPLIVEKPLKQIQVQKLGEQELTGFATEVQKPRLMLNRKRQ